MIRRVLTLFFILIVLTAADTPVARLRFEDNAASTTVVNSGSGSDATASANTSTMSATGTLGDAFDFESSASDYIYFSSDIIGTGADSLVFWIYPDHLNSSWSGLLFDNGNFKVYLDGDQDYVTLTNDGVTFANSAVSSISATTWQHVAILRDASGNIDFYIDNTLQNGTSTDGGTPSAGSSSLYVGGNALSSSFDGLMDDLFVFDREISTAEVQALSEMGSPIWSASRPPITYYRCEDNLATTAVVNDGMGDDGIASHNTNTFDGTGHVNNALDFYDSSVATYVDADSDVIGTGKVTVSLWYKMDGKGGGTSYGRFFDNGNFKLFVNDDTTEFGIQNDGSTTVTSSGWPGAIGTFTHLAVTRDEDGDVEFYRNGTSVTTGDAGTPTAGTGNLFFGSNTSGTQNFDGELDNFRVHDYIMSEHEISAMYEKELSGEFNFRSGKYLMKSGVPTLAFGIYHVDHSATGGNAAELTRATDIADIGTMGFDFVITPLSATNSATMKAARDAGVEVIPEWNEAGGYQAVDAAHGPFEMFMAYDDLDSGCDADCDETCAGIESEMETMLSNLSGRPLTYASAGNVVATVSDFFDCGLDMMAYQSYPIGDGNYNNKDIDSKDYFWPKMADYKYPFFANTQAFDWGGAYGLPDDAEITRMVEWAMDADSAGLFPYTYYDSGNDMGDEADLRQTYIDVMAEVSRCEEYWLDRLMTERE